MQEPRSAFVLNVIKGLPFTAANESYVRNLLAIEELVTRRPGTWTEGMHEEHLRAKYPDEFAAIFKELNPHGFIHDRRQKWERALEAEERRLDAEEARERERFRKMWIRLGGAAR